MRFLALVILLLSALLVPVWALPSKADQLFEEAFEAELALSPMRQSWLGYDINQGRWDDLSDSNAQERLRLLRHYRARIKTELRRESLTPGERLSYDLFLRSVAAEEEKFAYRFHNFPVNQMHGLHTEIPTLLMNAQVVTKVEEAEFYLQRLHGVSALVHQLIESLEEREKRGILPPKFVFDYVIADCERLRNDDGVLKDFLRKTQGLEGAEQLARRAEIAIEYSFKPAYQDLIVFLREQKERAGEQDGIWRLPDGKAAYELFLRQTTTTELTAEEIHQLGLAEVARIQGEMEKLKQEVGFKGSLAEFFTHLRESDRFYYSNDEEGRKKYLARATAVIDTMKARLDELFLRKPKADLEVRRVEAFREQSAGKAFYNTPPADSSSPGIYYANLYDMRSMPTYQLEALAYHEGIPGHHMQLTIAQELEGIPKFRRFGGYTAYIEGWGLYCEFLPKELGYYEDPYSDFGRLAMELWRACRLVVDTGIHSKRWTRQQGIDYYHKNTPNPLADCVKMVDRHIVMPGQATAYKVGMIKILQLREKARKSLGDRFDIREFHDVVLADGALPLDVLESQVDRYIRSKS